jgi:hypothetical protein
MADAFDAVCATGSALIRALSQSAPQAQAASVGHS